MYATGQIASGFAKLYPDVKVWTRLALADKTKIGGMSYPVIVGGPEAVADHLQKLVDEADVDGFSQSHFEPGSHNAPSANSADFARLADFSYVTSPGSFEDLVDFLVPELQRRSVALPLDPTSASQPIRRTTWLT